MRKPIALAILAALAGMSELPAQTAQSTGYKILAPRGAFASTQAGVQLLQDYGSFALYRIAGLSVNSAKGVLVANPEADVLRFSAQPFDTQRGTLTPPAPFSLRTTAGASLQVVQFIGPVRKEWLDALAARGIKPVQYVASNGYIVWADAAAQVQLASLRRTVPWLQYAAPYYGFLKV